MRHPPRSAVATLSSMLLLAPAVPAQAQWVVSAYAGAAFTRPADLRIEQPERATSLQFDRVRFEGRSFESPIYYGYRFARVFPRAGGLVVSAELIHAKAYADGAGISGRGVHRGMPVEAIPFPFIVRRLAVSHGLNFVFANVGVRRTLGERITATVMAGSGPVVPHAEVVVNGDVREDYQAAGLGLQGAAGAEWRLWRRISLLTEYKWTRAAVRLDLDTGTAKMNLSSHHLAAGFSAVF